MSTIGLHPYGWHVPVMFLSHQGSASPCTVATVLGLHPRLRIGWNKPRIDLGWLDVVGWF